MNGFLLTEKLTAFSALILNDYRWLIINASVWCSRKLLLWKKCGEYG